MNPTDSPWLEPMRRALALAERGGGATSPNPMVGCVLLDAGGAPIGEGWHARAGGPHAEVVALDAARAAGHDPAGATAIVSLEPCAAHGRTPPCTEALAAAGIARVVYGARDPHAGKGGEERLRAAGIEVIGGILTADAERLNEPWLHFAATGRSFLHLKVAQTLSGHVTRGAGRPRWITGRDARTAVHRLRRRYRAVLIGAGTARADDPLLTVREWPPPDGPDPPWPDVQPLRVVLDSRLRLPPDSRLAASAGPDRPVLVLCAGDAPEPPAAALADAGVEVVRLPAPEGRVDLDAAARELARREVSGALVEPGPTLAAAFLAAGLADRWTAFVAADADVGPDALALYAPSGPVRLPPLREVEVAGHGWDLAVTGRPVRGA